METSGISHSLASIGSLIHSDDVEISAYPIIGAADNELADYIAGYSSYSVARPRLLTADDVHLVGPHLICVNAEGQVLLESFRGEKGVRRSGFLTRNGDSVSWDSDAVSIVELDKGVAVGGKASGEFFHWMVEIVPRLMMVREAEALRRWPLLMRPVSRQYQLESIAALGLEPMYVTQDVIAVRSVTFPSHLVHHKGRGRISPRLIGMAKRFASEYLSIDRSKIGKRIYVSRGDAPKRRVVNEAEVQQLLAAYGFESVELSRLPLREQIALFCNAEVVVGLHGAGLTSTMFCNPGTRLVELYPERFMAVSPFWNLASLNGMDYRMVLCEALTKAGVSTHNADVRVSTELLTRALADMKVI